MTRIKLIKKNNEGFTPDAIKREGATGSIEIKEGPQEGDLIYTPAAQRVAKKLGDDLLMAILAAASDEAWSQADEYEWKDTVDTDHGLEWNTCQALGWGFDDMDKAAPFKGGRGKVYSGDVAKNACNAIAALAEDDRYSLFFNNQPRNYSHIRDVVATAMDMAADDEGEDESASEDRRGTDRYGHSVKRFTTKDLKDLDGEVISGNDGSDDDAGTPSNFGLAYLDTASMDALSNDFRTQECDRFLHDLAQMPVSKKSIEDLLRKHKLHKFGDPIGVRDFFPENGIAYLGTYASDGLPYKDLCLRWGPALKK